MEGADALHFERATQPNLDSITSKSPLINAPNNEEVIKESGNSIPISVIKPELFNFQVKEIDEAVMTNGQNPNGSEIPKTATIKVFNSPTQNAILAENERTHMARIRATRKNTHIHTQNL